jgi:hypothetical protein
VPTLEGDDDEYVHNDRATQGESEELAVNTYPFLSVLPFEHLIAFHVSTVTVRRR